MCKSKGKIKSASKGTCESKGRNGIVHETESKRQSDYVSKSKAKRKLSGSESKGKSKVEVEATVKVEAKV